MGLFNKIKNMFKSTEKVVEKNKNIKDDTSKNESKKQEEKSVKVYEKGQLVYESPSVNDIARYCKEQVDNLWDEVKRFEKPHTYYVDLSAELWEQRSALLHKHSK